MTDRPLRNVATSVRQRLRHAAKQSGRPFQEVLQDFAMERCLYRVSLSPHIERFMLEGALVFHAHSVPASTGQFLTLFPTQDNQKELSRSERPVPIL